MAKNVIKKKLLLYNAEDSRVHEHIVDCEILSSDESNTRIKHYHPYLKKDVTKEWKTPIFNRMK